MRRALLIASAVIAWCGLAPVTTAAAGPASFRAAQKALVDQYFGTLAGPTLYTVDTQTGKPGKNVQAWAWMCVPPPEPDPTNASAIVWTDGGHPGFSPWTGFNPGKAHRIVGLYNTSGVSPEEAGLEIVRPTA